VAASTPRKKKNVKQLLAEAQRAVRTVDICTRADLVDEYEILESRIAKKKEAAGDSLAGADTAAMEARLAALKEEMADASITFKIRALPDREFTKLVAEYPARKGNKPDEVLGMNIDDVVEQLIRRGTEEPEMDGGDWEKLLGEVLNKATYEQLTNAAWSVNRQDVSVPFS
jgi:hypothetical protein